MKFLNNVLQQRHQWHLLKFLKLGQRKKVWSTKQSNKDSTYRWENIMKIVPMFKSKQYDSDKNKL